MKVGLTALVFLCMGLISPFESGALAQTAGREVVIVQGAPDAPPVRRRPRLRVYPYEDQQYVIPRYNPGPGAVRECNATYVQEFRPSGTVIVPHMNCYWRRG